VGNGVFLRPVHRRSQDFVWVHLSSPKKLTTFFSHRPDLPNFLKKWTLTALPWGCTLCMPGGALKIFLCKFGPNIFVRPVGVYVHLVHPLATPMVLLHFNHCWGLICLCAPTRWRFLCERLFKGRWQMALSIEWLSEDERSAKGRFRWLDSRRGISCRLNWKLLRSTAFSKPVGLNPRNQLQYNVPWF